jgi:prevent-host-death family protein
MAGEKVLGSNSLARSGHLEPSSNGAIHLRTVRPPLGLKGYLNQAILAIMKKASITEAKNNLSALIDRVKAGSAVLIMDRGRPVARLEPVSALRSDDDARLARLVREGVVRPARRSGPKDLFATRPPRLKKGTSGVRTLLEERRDGR